MALVSGRAAIKRRSAPLSLDTATCHHVAQDFLHLGSRARQCAHHLGGFGNLCDVLDRLHAQGKGLQYRGFRTGPGENFTSRKETENDLNATRVADCLSATIGSRRFAGLYSIQVSILDAHVESAHIEGDPGDASHRCGRPNLWNPVKKGGGLTKTKPSIVAQRSTVDPTRREKGR